MKIKNLIKLLLVVIFISCDNKKEVDDVMQISDKCHIRSLISDTLYYDYVFSRYLTFLDESRWVVVAKNSIELTKRERDYFTDYLLDSLNYDFDSKINLGKLDTVDMKNEKNYVSSLYVNFISSYLIRPIGGDSIESSSCKSTATSK